MAHPALTTLDQDQLDWISRFADRLRLVDAAFADEHRSEQANEIARSMWERSDWRRQSPEEAAERWLAQRGRH
ncbi:MAG TPA: hypothetical protein VJ743_00865 [Albitalea sp.]|nr:hypothetical protein [Albitalea sp.]